MNMCQEADGGKLSAAKVAVWRSAVELLEGLAEWGVSERALELTDSIIWRQNLGHAVTFLQGAGPPP